MGTFLVFLPYNFFSTKRLWIVRDEIAEGLFSPKYSFLSSLDPLRRFWNDIRIISTKFLSQFRYARNIWRRFIRVKMLHRIENHCFRALEIISYLFMRLILLTMFCYDFTCRFITSFTCTHYFYKIIKFNTFTALNGAKNYTKRDLTTEVLYLNLNKKMNSSAFLIMWPASQ